MLGSYFGCYLIEELAVEVNFAVFDLVAGFAGEYVRQGTLAGPVRSHNCVHRTWLDAEVQLIDYSFTAD